MKNFFEALERAEMDRALRGTAVTAPVAPEPAVAVDPPAAPAPPAWAPEPAATDPHLASLLRPTGREAEEYRTLRYSVEQGHRTLGLSVVGITSAAPRDGKTLTAINLAGAMAQAPGTRVLLIDLDLRQPSVAHRLGLEAPTDGVTRLLLDPRVALAEVVTPCPPFNLTVLTSNRPLDATYELFKSARFGEMIGTAREQYDYVVLDLPPLIPMPDCRIVEKFVDGFLVVVAAHATPRKLLNEALATVDPAKVAGLVLNGIDTPLTGYAYGARGKEPSGWRRLLPFKRNASRNDELKAAGRGVLARGRRKLAQMFGSEREKSPFGA